MESINKHNLQKFWKHNQTNLITLGVCFFIILFCYALFSNGDFSFLLTLSSMVELFGFCLLAYKSVREQSVTGISLKSLEFYAVVVFSRLCSILFYDSYLPYDKSGDFLYPFCEVLTLLAIAANIVMILFVFPTTHNGHMDVFSLHPAVPMRFGHLPVAAGLLFFSMIFHTKLNRNAFTDTMWTFSHYLEAIAIFPQLLMFQRNKTGEVESLTSHFVTAMAVSRAFQFLFWGKSFHELSNSSSKFTVGHLVLLSHVVQIALMANFLYYYIQSLRSGNPLRLPVLVNAKI